MGIRTCSSDEGTWLYESCSMRPINTTHFHDEEEADAFIELANKRGVSIGNADTATLERLQDELRTLPKCTGCDEIVVFPGENRKDQCEDCADAEAYDARVEAERAGAP